MDGWIDFSSLYYINNDLFSHCRKGNLVGIDLF